MNLKKMPSISGSKSQFNSKRMLQNVLCFCSISIRKNIQGKLNAHFHNPDCLIGDLKKAYKLESKDRFDKALEIYFEVTGHLSDAAAKSLMAEIPGGEKLPGEIKCLLFRKYISSHFEKTWKIVFRKAKRPKSLIWIKEVLGDPAAEEINCILDEESHWQYYNLT